MTPFSDGMLSLHDSIRRVRRNAFSTRTTEDMNVEYSIPTEDQSQASSLVDGRLLVGPDQTKTTALDWPHMQFKHKDAENGAVTSIALSPDGKLLAAS